MLTCPPKSSLAFDQLKSLTDALCRFATERHLVQVTDCMRIIRVKVEICLKTVHYAIQFIHPHTGNKYVVSRWQITLENYLIACQQAGHLKTTVLQWCYAKRFTVIPGISNLPVAKK